MRNSVPYLIVAYIGTALLYAAYLVRLLAQERRLERRDRGPAR